MEICPFNPVKGSYLHKAKVIGETLLIVGTTHRVIELVDLIKDGSPGTETNMSCLIIFVLEVFLVFPGSVGEEGTTI